MKLTFSQSRFLEEIKLRGQVMAMSTSLEFLLLKIIVACLADVPNIKAREFKRLSLEAKIAMLRQDLKEYNSEKYTKYLATIKRLNKIKNFRNKFAHCKIEWDVKERDVSFFFILIISDVKGKEKPHLIKMTYVEFQKKMAQIKLTIMELLDLCKEIEEEFIKKYPNFFNDRNVI